MVKEHTLMEKVILKETSTLENLRITNLMVKGHTLGLMVESMWGSGKRINVGTEQDTTNTETFWRNG